MLNKVINRPAPVVFLPYWFESIFARGQISTRDIFNIEKLYQHISTEDLCVLVQLNQTANEYFNLASEWRSYTEDSKNILSDHILPQQALFIRDLEERLFNPQQNDAQSCIFKTQAVYQSEEAGMKICVFVYPQVKSAVSKKKELFELYKSISQLQFDSDRTLKASPAYYKYVEML